MAAACGEFVEAGATGALAACGVGVVAIGSGSGGNGPLAGI